MTSSTHSPCIGICSTVYGDNICRGCRRDFHEVIDWNRYTAEQKQAIHQRLQQQIETVTERFVTVENAEQLQLQLKQASVLPQLYDSPLCWAYTLLRLKAKEMQSLADYGLCAKSPYAHLSANALFTQLDDALYEFAQEIS